MVRVATGIRDLKQCELAERHVMVCLWKTLEMADVSHICGYFGNKNQPIYLPVYQLSICKRSINISIYIGIKGSTGNDL